MNNDRPHSSRVRRYGPDVAFAVLAAAAAAMRAVALRRVGAPPGFDGGDWLALGRGILGHSVRPRGVVAAPIPPLLTWATYTLVGNAAFVGLSAMLSIAPATGLYWVLRRLISPWPAVLFSAFLLAGAAAGEAAAWGGYPQLLGLGFLPPALWLVDRALEEGGRRRAIAGGVGLLSVALTSDFVFVTAACASALLLLLRLARARRNALSARNLIVTLGAIAAPLLLAAPLYARLLSARVAAVTHPTRLLGAHSFTLRERVDAVWFDRPAIWWLLAVLGVAGIARFRNRRNGSHWRLAVALAIPVVAFVGIFPEPRLAYFVPTAVVLAASVGFNAVNENTPLYVGMLATALAFQFVALPHTANLQRQRYQALTPDLVSGIRWLRTNTPSSATFVVTPYRDAPPVGWWVEGLGNRRTLSASSSEWVYFKSERVTAARASRVLSAGVPTPATLGIARRFGVTYVFVDKRWPEYRIARVSNLRSKLPGIVAFENKGVVILRTSVQRRDHSVG